MNLTLFVIIELIGAIILIWNTAVAMIEQKRIKEFFPFFIAGLTLIFDAAFSMHRIYLGIAWLWIEISYIFAISFILINLIKNKIK